MRDQLRSGHLVDQPLPASRRFHGHIRARLQMPERHPQMFPLLLDTNRSSHLALLIDAHKNRIIPVRIATNKQARRLFRNCLGDKVSLIAAVSPLRLTGRDYS